MVGGYDGDANAGYLFVRMSSALHTMYTLEELSRNESHNYRLSFSW